MSAVLKSVGGPTLDELFLTLPVGFDPRTPDEMPGLPECTRISERARFWFKAVGTGHVPTILWLKARSPGSTMSGDDLLSEVLGRSTNPWIDREPTIPLRLLSREDGRALLNPYGVPNLFLADKKRDLAINVCRIWQTLHIPAHWDVDLIEIHGKARSVFANPRIIYPLGDR